MSKGARALAVAGFIRVSAVSLALFVLLEWSARLLIFGPAGLDPRRVGILRDLDPAELVRFDTEPELVYEYKPNLDVFFKGVHFRTNSRGMRDREPALAKPPGTFRVAVLGSSFTLPVGVEIQDAFHSLLEERCSRERAPARCEFLNFAVGMHGPSQFLAMLKHRALAFEPDLVLVEITAMAAPRMLADFRDVPPRDVLRLVAPGGPRSLLVKLIQSRLGLGRPSFAAPPRALSPPVPEAQQVVAKLGEISRERGLPIIVVRLEYDSRPPSALERTLEARVLEEGMLYLDTRAAFRGMQPQDFWIHELDPHPNRRAHALFADVLEEFLRSRGLFSGVLGSRSLLRNASAGSGTNIGAEQRWNLTLSGTSCGSRENELGLSGGRIGSEASAPKRRRPRRGRAAGPLARAARRLEPRVGAARRPGPGDPDHRRLGVEPARA